jgi:glycine hydroxymethyltransferase
MLADGVAAKTHSAAGELLDAHPLYPGLDLG